MFLIKNFKLLVVVGLVCAMALGPVSAEDPPPTDGAKNDTATGTGEATTPKAGGMKCSATVDCEAGKQCVRKGKDAAVMCDAECPSGADATKCNDKDECCCVPAADGCNMPNGTATALFHSFGGFSFLTVLSALVYFIPSKTLA